MTDRIPPLPRSNAERNAERHAKQADVVTRARLATPITASSGRDILDARLPRPFGLGSAELD